MNVFQRWLAIRKHERAQAWCWRQMHALNSCKIEAYNARDHEHVARLDMALVNTRKELEEHRRMVRQFEYGVELSHWD